MPMRLESHLLHEQVNEEPREGCDSEIARKDQKKQTAPSEFA